VVGCREEWDRRGKFPRGPRWCRRQNGNHGIFFESTSVSGRKAYAKAPLVAAMDGFAAGRIGRSPVGDVGAAPAATGTLEALTGEHGRRVIVDNNVDLSRFCTDHARAETLR